MGPGANSCSASQARAISTRRPRKARASRSPSSGVAPWANPSKPSTPRSAKNGPKPFTVRATSELVLLDVQVLHAKTATPAPLLEAGDFVVSEEGISQRIVHFSRDEFPLSVILLFDLTDSVSGYLNPRVIPDIILLMIGTNDINRQFQVDQAPAKLDHLISLISDRSTGLRPNTKLIVSSILPIDDKHNQFAWPGADPNRNQDVDIFNATIPL